MPFVYPAVSTLQNTEKVDGGECARLVQHFLPQVGHTSTWIPGERVMDVLRRGHTIAPGTAIATFVNGRYPDHGHRHAALFEFPINACNYNPKLFNCGQPLGFSEMGQWNSSNPQYPKPRISRRGLYVRHHAEISDDPEAFYIIEHR